MTDGKRRAIPLAAFVLALFSCVFLAAARVSAEPVEGTCGDGVFWSLDDGGVLTVGGEGRMDDYDTVADAPWNDLHDRIKRVIFEDGVLNVGRGAFEYCEKMTRVSLSPSVEIIGERAFARCYSLADIAINGFVKEIGREAFIDDDALRSLYLGRGIERIGESAFESCRALKSLRIPTGVTEIGDQAFFGCTGIATATIPSTVTSLGQAAFGYCTSLTEITVPASVGAVPDYCFFGCSSLGRVILNDGIVSVGEEAFLGCASLEIIYVPSTVEEIAPYSIGYCYRNGYRRVEGTEIAAVPGSVGGSYAVGNLFYIRNADPAHECGSRCEFCGKCLDDGCSFWNCYEKCPGHPFPVTGRDGAVCWRIDGDGTLTLSGEGAMNDYAAGGAPWYPYRRLVTRVTVEEGITTVGKYAFWEFGNAAEAALPRGVVSVGSKAFFDCASLQSVELPDTLLTVGDYAFSYCGSVTAVTLPDSVTTVGRFAFYRTPLETVSLGNAVSVGECAFDTGGALREAALPPTLTEIGLRAFGYEYAGGGFRKTPGFLITGERGGAAERYARENGFPFVTSDWKFPFSDVSAGAWYREPVTFVAKRGLFGGVTDTEFAPAGPMTRGMFVTVLWRMDGTPTPAGGNPFSDVRAGAYYEKAAAWAAENGVAGGVGGGRFDPDGGVTREQIASMLMRYAEYRGEDTSGRADLGGFPDGGKVSRYARNGVAWALDQGIVRGVGTGTGACLKPQAGATRAEVAAMIMRFAERAG